MNKRNPLKDPQAGDVFVMADGYTVTVETRAMRRLNQIEYGLGRNIKEYVKYRIKEHPGLLCPQGITGFLKRLKGAKILHGSN